MVVVSASGCVSDIGINIDMARLVVVPSASVLTIHSYCWNW
jgi:hypothetical protein